MSDDSNPSEIIPPPWVVVVGTSSGGNEALESLVAGLPQEIPASIIIVRHLAPEASAGYIVRRLKHHCSLPCAEAKDGEPLQAGKIYMAPADRHTLVDETKLWVIRGARENRWRPAVDPLFRSAAVSYRNKVVGVVLTGYLDDGAAGLIAIKRCGGTCVVQDPNDATFPDMPRNALTSVSVDYTLPVAEMGPLIAELVNRRPEDPAPGIPKDLLTEDRIVKRGVTQAEVVDEIGDRSILTCPDCGGVLWQVGNGEFTRFRCHTGHSYTLSSLLSGQSTELEETIWRAMRMFEERRNLLKKMASTMGHLVAQSMVERAKQDEVHITRLRTLLDDVANPAAEPIEETV
jgi:two-component system, chemotaxis family, protein-glutamate methylesterase/glutaminase